MVLRAGCKLHLQKYTQLPDDATDPPTRPELEPLLARVTAMDPVKKFVVATATYRAFAGQGEDDHQHHHQHHALSSHKQQGRGEEGEDVKSEQEEDGVKSEEQEDGSGDGDGGGGKVKAEPAADGEGAAAAAPPAAPAGPPTTRPPCMWMLLTPVREPGAARPEGEAAGDMALPIHIDGALPDFLIPAATYEERVKKSWTPGERFRMYFGGKHGQKVRIGWLAGCLMGASVNLPIIVCDLPPSPESDPNPHRLHAPIRPPPCSPPGRRRVLQGHHHLHRHGR
jgi:hypothetical protein